MGRIQSSHRAALLRLSALGFAMLTGILAFGYFWIFEVLGSTTPALWSRDLRIIVLSFALPAMPGAALSWWVLVVLPRRSSALAGGWAGLLTIVLAPLGVSVGLFATGVFSAAHTPPWQVIEWTLMFWLIGLLIVCATPQGWGMLVVGGVAGALYGALVGRGLAATRSAEAADAGLRPDGSQDAENGVVPHRAICGVPISWEGSVTDRIMRWLSGISLVSLALSAAWFLGNVASVAYLIHPGAGWPAGYAAAFVLFPATIAAVCNVTGVMTLVVSAQRRQWVWFAGALICLAAYFYGPIVLSASSFIRFAVIANKALIGGGSSAGFVRILAFYDSVVILTPIIALSLLYAWTRRWPSLASATGHGA